MRLALLVAFAGLGLAGQTAWDSISADSLRTHLSYIASDELEGRATPSHGLDMAADYIAAQFRAHGLQPAEPGGSYFQTARFAESRASLEGFRLRLNDLEIPAEAVRIRSLRALDLNDGPVLKLPANGTIPPIEGLVVAGDLQRYGGETFLDQLQSRKPALILLIGQNRKGAARKPRPFLDDVDAHHAPVINIASSDAALLLHGDLALKLTVHFSQPAVSTTAQRNVVAMLPGSDPALRNQYVLLTAHYDHLGKSAAGIFNGANDNGSGTVSVIEIAGALAALPVHPRRSILFITFFGEEEGLLGSYYYTAHPLAPLERTVAEINLEQLGRTDEKTGKQVGTFAFTGGSYSNLPGILKGAGKQEGITGYTRPDADSFFPRSDNYPFALHGVVDTTAAVAFDYPDYHGLGDKIAKIDFDNMAKVDRAIAAGVLRVANQTAVPKWSSAKAAAIYREAVER